MFSQSGKILAFEEQSLEAFVKLLITEYDNWEQRTIGAAVKNAVAREQGSIMKQGQDLFDQFVIYLRALFAGENRFNIQDVANFLRVGVPDLLNHARKVLGISIEGDVIVIQPVLWEPLTEDIYSKDDRKRFSTELDADFSHWGAEAKKKQ